MSVKKAYRTFVLAGLFAVAMMVIRIKRSPMHG
jgi:hypothetical protein